MESISCLICGADKGRPIFDRESPRHVICRRCGFVYENPRPSFAEMLAYYRSGYYESLPPADPTARSERGEAICSWAGDRIGPDDLVVEIGCGHGAALNHVRRQFGCKAIGIEPSESQAAVARATFGLDVIGGGFENADIGEGKAKLVFLFHVLEHLHDPIAAIRKCGRALADDGVLFIEVPNVLNPNRRKRLSAWFSLEHIWYFSPATLTAVAAMAGFSPLRIEATNAVRLLARNGGSPVTIPNEFGSVRRALWRHDAVYWPRKIMAKLLGRG
ncbi:MAG TPA: class I SAM-dependent methyltransferase [Pirellulales bacterium]|jgi:SAM-dependent methyltransferase|nr:class I SAM-dependent methyltransferase [Pirellulales bacterium]